MKTTKTEQVEKLTAEYIQVCKLFQARKTQEAEELLAQADAYRKENEIWDINFKNESKKLFKAYKEMCGIGGYASKLIRFG